MLGMNDVYNQPALLCIEDPFTPGKQNIPYFLE